MRSLPDSAGRATCLSLLFMHARNVSTIGAPAFNTFVFPSSGSFEVNRWAPPMFAPPPHKNKANDLPCTGQDIFSPNCHLQWGQQQILFWFAEPVWVLIRRLQCHASRQACNKWWCLSLNSVSLWNRRRTSCCLGQRRTMCFKVSWYKPAWWLVGVC